MNPKRTKDNKLLCSYITKGKKELFYITVSGIFYNVGMTAGPLFEGKMAQMLADIIHGTKQYADMVLLAMVYVGVILFVQGMRYVKRLYVRKYANHMNRDMKENIYHAMLQEKKQKLEEESVGSLMTKAIVDVDACVEGIRKFITEIFDTGVVMVAYFVMLLYYDWRLTLLAMIFPPIAYVIADQLKKTVTRSARAFKESTGRLSQATLDRVGNAMTYRIYGQETNRDLLYEECLEDYEKKAIRANIWENVMQPLYLVISMTSCLCILWFGGKNVMHQGWTQWNIAAFVTYLSCFTKLASKSSKAAKLFNAVQKASVSWKRIEPILSPHNTVNDSSYLGQINAGEDLVSVEEVSFHYPQSTMLFHDVTFHGKAGEIIGVTGPVACGKSTLGKLFLGDLAYEGTIQIRGDVSYMGHEPELILGTIEDNILLGDTGDVWEALQWVEMEEEVRQMPEGIHTRIGNGGVTLSGGQQARIALARTLWHRKEVLILDDPFSALDMQTEERIFETLQKLTKNSTVLLFSHRLTLFPKMNQVIWMKDGIATVSTHEALLQTNKEYAALYQAQQSTEGMDAK